jgi:hypothetical protein
MGVGFIFGFWGVCCTLIVKTSYRQAYFQSFNNLKDKIAILVMFKVAPQLKKLGQVGEKLRQIDNRALFN